MTARKVYKEISKVLTEAINGLNEGYTGSSLTDIFLVVDKDSGSLSVFDDEENLLSQVIVEAWASEDDDQVIARQLREVVEQFDMDNKFDSLDVFKPFSINIADENLVVLEELLVIEDDSIIRIENDFLSRIDKEFDDFLDKLLKE
ncbi:MULTISPECIES: hypothetical protein [unclassified Dysgonomonas]|uniref:hypothetical protein n=1 Tax=unclassified Dysgonomonas TaxID=2630389 RepID=UPI000682DD46|nr:MULTISPECIES: hypothetical protein [unclassified Dysgonomonas]MBD8349557.1 hypothetical protein [Dysgonomonas sp. HGC4]MBF0577842.1 hypothetical protein [Dysgonomonas sp. GY617]